MKDAAALRVEDLRLRYGDVPALRGASFDVGSGEFCVVLGPSGCGKTTLLKCIAGLLPPDGGGIWIKGTDVTRVPPHRRNIGLVFQDYALFPHRRVWDNVAFGLRMRELPRAEIGARVRRSLAAVGIEPLAQRFPHELSGGQQQRVALARSLVIEPELLMLDEPLSSLDYRLQREMQSELRRVQREAGVTFLYVSHDLDQAFALADRVVLLRDGTVEQVGPPSEVYHRPGTVFAARLTGAISLLEGKVTAERGGELAVETRVGRVLGRTTSRVLVGALLQVGVRPERLLLGPEASGSANRFPAMLVGRTFRGASVELEVLLADGSPATAIKPAVAPFDGLVVGKEITVGWQPEDTVLIQEEQR